MLAPMSTRTRTHRTARGERVTFLRTAHDTGGDLLEMQVTYAPNAEAPPLHLHPEQEERFEVRRGAMWTRIGTQEVTYATGERFVVPAGTPHTMRPAADDGAEVVWQVRPAFESEAFFRIVWGIDGEAVAGGRPGLLRSVAIARRFTREFRVCRPPYPVQRILFALLGPVAAWAGHRPAEAEPRQGAGRR
jgi:quercetin dioxygenase-like cupin family protein